jgi:hypothetical protein
MQVVPFSKEQGVYKGLRENIHYSIFMLFTIFFVLGQWLEQWDSG